MFQIQFEHYEMKGLTSIFVSILITVLLEMEQRYLLNGSFNL